MQITYEGHSCFSLRNQEGNMILIDPFISENPLCAKAWQDFHPQLILVTHAHRDHLGDALAIARASQGVLAGQVDLLESLSLEGISSLAFNLGGTIRLLGFTITMTQAIHGARNADGSYGGVAAGYIISDGKINLYHAGDTALFGDMQSVISRYQLDYALLPIGDFYTMGPTDAITAAHWLQAKTIIPMH
ncbi:MAG: metal-dependent hydrolase, partial [Clostridiales bacterium]